MNTSNLDFRGFNSNRRSYYKRQIKMRFASKRATVIAWALFFGVGVAYFIASLVIAIV
ncbi:MAG: hypothetical protein HYZ14_09335 [Bacteroidetes bacterium]|nr:hypothetical protein [Bacteroidota bacterium]